MNVPRILLLLAGLAVLGYLLFTGNGGKGEVVEKTSDPAAEPEPVGRPGAAGGSGNLMPEAELSLSLNSPDHSVFNDISIIDTLIRSYRGVYGVNPSGDNIDITAALSGNNPNGFRYLPEGHPAVNARGELLDRWGTAWFFHSQAHDHTELRSAGPDKELFTSDDITDADL